MPHVTSLRGSLFLCTETLNLKKSKREAHPQLRLVVLVAAPNRDFTLHRPTPPTGEEKIR